MAVHCLHHLIGLALTELLKLHTVSWQLQGSTKLLSPTIESCHKAKLLLLFLLLLLLLLLPMLLLLLPPVCPRWYPRPGCQKHFKFLIDKPTKPMTFSLNFTL